MKLRDQLRDEQLLAMDRLDPTSIMGVLAFSIFIGVTAQSLINSMIQGDQGLGAFLSDGDGFSNSKFKPVSRKTARVDPLPWLKLPKFDFVEVAGQENTVEERVLVNERDNQSKDRLQMIQLLIQRMEKELQMGDTEGALKTKLSIDLLLKQSDEDKIKLQ